MMNCHENNNKNGHSSIKHLLHMVLCCGLPIIIIALVPFIARFSSGGARVLYAIAPFLCPVMMLGMILMMFLGGRKKSCCNNSKNIDN